MHGYHGRYLKINVSSGDATWVDLSSQRLRHYMGGSGLGTAILTDEYVGEIDVLAAESSLVFAFSPLVGSPLTTSAKFAVVSKSPLTNMLNDALAGSRFAIAGKQCGADALVITGRADRPSVLLVDDGRMTLHPADDLWGLTIPLAEDQLRRRYGIDFSFAVIGPAGEHLVRYASISHDGRHAGRGGSGAVLGSKQIKAIGVRGTRRTSWADVDGLIAYARQLSRRSFGPATAKYRELGTASNLLLFNRLHMLPTRNFQSGSFREAASLAPDRLSVNREKARSSCACCTIGCEHLYGVRRDSASDGGLRQVRVEYESLFALGPLCGIGDPDVVLRATRLCDDLGLDTISTGGTIGFAMECVERGLIDEPVLRFGDGESLLQVLDDIAHRRGIGDALAEGSRRLADAVGQQSIDFAPQVKGLELPGYEPRALQTMALGFAVGSRGADHNRSGAYEIDFSDCADRRCGTSESARLAVETENRAALIDSLILCKFLRGVFDDIFEESATMLRLVTGWDMSAAELRNTSRRIVNVRKAFNISAGWTPAEDTLPARFLDNPLPDDPQACLTKSRLQQMITAYNLARGWTSDGYLNE